MNTTLTEAKSVHGTTHPTILSYSELMEILKDVIDEVSDRSENEWEWDGWGDYYAEQFDDYRKEVIAEGLVAHYENELLALIDNRETYSNVRNVARVMKDTPAELHLKAWLYDNANTENTKMRKIAEKVFEEGKIEEVFADFWKEEERVGEE